MHSSLSNKAEKDRYILLFFCLSFLSTEMMTNVIFKDKVLPLTVTTIKM